tara:strand:- start:4294 stop:5865 length:1572 start_codon:yes stop_codon:yes gene_type:complete
VTHRGLMALVGIMGFSQTGWAAQHPTSVDASPKTQIHVTSFAEEVIRKVKEREDGCPWNCTDAVKRWQERTLPVPEKLISRVRFWRRVYSDWNYTQMAFHDRDDLSMIYAVVDVPWPGQRLNGLTRKETIIQTKKKLSRVLEDLEAMQPTSTQGLEGLHRQVFLALMHSTRGDKYRRQEIMRAQNGLKDTFAQAIENSGRYRPMMLKVLKKNDLPEDLAAVVFVESLFQNRAKSYAGAAGLWQFMPRTGKEYMSINALVDERYDPELATESAAQYLKSAFARLGTWPLAVTSYNVGVAGMFNGVRSVGTHDFGTIVENYYGNRFGFAARNYYAEVLAALEVYRHRARFFPNVQPLPPWRFDVVRLPFPLLFSQAVHLGGVSQKELLSFNPALRSGVLEDKVVLPRGFSLRLPMNTANAFLMGIDDVDLRTRRAIAKRVELKHKANGRESISNIAAHHRVSTKNLARLMGMKPEDLPPKGTMIPVPKRAKNHSLIPRARHLPLPVFDDLVFASERERLRAKPRS